MSRVAARVLFSIALGAGLGSCASLRRPRLCESIRIEGPELRFTSSEIKLLCGDPDSEAWREIPAPQRRFHLETFLLERGYFAPEIEAAPDGGLNVRVGSRALLNQLEIEGWPAKLERVSSTRFLSRPISSALLDEIEESFGARLRGGGYPCPTIRTQAFPRESKVRLEIDHGAFRNFGPIERNVVDGFDPEVLRRFEPFVEDEAYDPRLLILAERRIRTKGILQDAVYAPTCEGDRFRVTLHPFVGKAHFLSLGAGFDTEEWFFGRIRFSAQRLTQLGASLDTVLFGSFKTQSLDLVFDAPFGDLRKRQSLESGFKLERKDTPSYESLSLAGRGGYLRRFEALETSLDFRVGLAAEKLWLRRGEGPDESHLLALESSLLSTSHLFEYYADSPLDGWRWEVGWRGTSRAVGSSFTAAQVTARAEFLNVVWEGPEATFVWGNRIAGALNWAPAGRTDLIPPARRHYLGGSRDLRGFSRQELPRNGDGAVSTLFAGTELRMTRYWGVEPLVFLDAGSLDLGRSSPRVPLYLSPGTGLRYRLPFGTLRGTASRGFSAVPRPEDVGKDHWEFFLSFGEEF